MQAGRLVTIHLHLDDGMVRPTLTLTNTLPPHRYSTTLHT